MKDIENKIIDIIDTLRPFLINDGGNIEFIKYENDIVYIKMMGACSNCEMLDLTLKDGIEAAIKEDKAPIAFVFKFFQKYEGSKKALEKLKSDGASL